MGKETKKDHKKGFPLQTTPQSNAYKQQVNVYPQLSRNKMQYF